MNSSFIAVHKGKIIGKMIYKGFPVNEPNIQYKVKIGKFKGIFEDIDKDIFLDMVSMIKGIKIKKIKIIEVEKWIR